ncbi:polynucleotide kinase-phosphatase [Aureivirga marina]|uniref:polynucleotide kinase-phosphatase n=1 Tax=Aureivirga marina TaxID=1182451 RepID=UPI0018C99952|nr:polynucleotide kinase-phosphatase [Aureivirga marina]
MKNINIPKNALVLLIGASGAGKSTFANKHFEKYEIVSSDVCRGMVSNAENTMDANTETFELLEFIVSKRLKRGLLTVIDATNVHSDSRKNLLKIAKKYHVLSVAIVLDLPEEVSIQRNETREDRNFGNHVIRNHKRNLRHSLKFLKKEGFKKIYKFKTEDEINEIEGIFRDKLYNDKKEFKGPFDIIGDIHGCYDETISLLEKLNYQIEFNLEDEENFGIKVTHPENRKVIFLGDLVDRGPNSPAVLKLAMSMVKNGTAFCVPGNHDEKLKKKLEGRNVQTKHGLKETLEQLENETDAFKEQVREFIYGLTSHYIFDDGNLVVSHAGLREEMHGRTSGEVRSFCLYGETTGEIDEFGLPVRLNWASEYRGKAKVAYGHTPVKNAEWFNNTIDLDTGCVFGGKLTALRYPESKLVSVSANKMYCKPARPFDVDESENSSQQINDEILEIDNLLGKKYIDTELQKNILIKEENAIPALETMTRWGIDPRWMIYLPPTMSPCATSDLEEYLEHPKEAIQYYQKRGVSKIICEEKHMGSRAILVICKDTSIVKKRFGINSKNPGICYTRTGRNFFSNKTLEQQFIFRISEVLTKANFWEEFETDWVCLDAELMPWSAKAQLLLKNQYAAVGSSAKQSLNTTLKQLEKAKARNIEGLNAVLEKVSYKSKAIDKYISSYQNYCWDVTYLDDFKLAPFHILATEGKTYEDKTHLWHMKAIAKICDADSKIMLKTKFQIVDTTKKEDIEKAIAWWGDLTNKKGEGFVVKPLDFIAYHKNEFLQPAIKCRGKEYLRIIYGPEYDLQENLKRLKNRGLAKKRTLARKEFSLGIDALQHFVRKQPLRKTHERVFGILAMESEMVDPRL